MGGSGRRSGDLAWPDRLELVVFEWRGTLHAYVQRVGSTPSTRVPRRLRIASRTWPSLDATVPEYDALRQVSEWLSEVVARMTPPEPRSGPGVPLGGP